MRPDRHAPRRHDHVGLERALERTTVGLVVVRHRGQYLCQRAGRGKLRSEHYSVGLVDLARPERLAWGPELGPGRQDGGPRTAARGHRRKPGCGQAAELGGGDTHTRASDDVANAYVPAARTDVGTRGNGIRDLHFVVMIDNILDGDDGIGALGHDAARRDSHRLPDRERTIGRPAGCDPEDDRQRGGRVSRADGESVHRRAREGRQVDASDCVLGQVPARAPHPAKQALSRGAAPRPESARAHRRCSAAETWAPHKLLP